jgi:hypothetical protein
LALINLDAADHEPNHGAPGSPVEQVEVLTDARREVPQASNDQGQVTSGLDRSSQSSAVLLQLSNADSQVGHARLELRAVNHTICVSIDQPPDPAPQGADAALDLPYIAIYRVIRRQFREAAPVLMSNPLRLVENGLDIRPHNALEAIAAYRAVGAHRLTIEPVAIAADAAVGAVTECTRAMALSKTGSSLAIVGIAAAPTHNQTLKQPAQPSGLLPLAPPVLLKLSPGCLGYSGIDNGRHGHRHPILARDRHARGRA